MWRGYSTIFPQNSELLAYPDGTTSLDDGVESISVDSAHVPSATAQKMSMANKFKRKQKPITAQAKPSRRRGKGLNLKIGADGSMHLRHMAELGQCTAVMPSIEIAQED